MVGVLLVVLFFFFKQKTAYEMRISDWSSDVCSSDLEAGSRRDRGAGAVQGAGEGCGPPACRWREGGDGLYRQPHPQGPARAREIRPDHRRRDRTSVV